MKFGPVPVADALGAILAHSLPVKGGRIRKGRVLSAQDLNALAGAGHDQISVAQLEAGDIAEDEAAAQIATAMVGTERAAGVRLSVASTGRVNVFATGPGVLGLDVAAIEAANLVDPMITIATLPPYARTAERRMLATIKIISYGVAEANAAEAADRLSGALQVHPVKMKTACLIQTDTGGASLEKGAAVIGARMQALGMELTECATVPHEIAPLSDAIKAAQADLILILTGSATSDIADTAPEALRRAGGQVTRFGLPVDPGNLLFLGELSGVPVIGLPGCARSPALNGADWVLERVVCGLPVGARDMAAMGVGGLLKESPARGLPRDAG